jgi:hypothetical protein
MEAGGQAMMTNDPNLVWSATMDERYLIRVVRTEPYSGELVILDGDKELLREEVVLSYNALFGPDVFDVEAWQDRAIKFIDGRMPDVEPAS